MAIYLNWRTYTINSTQRFIARLFENLSSRYYPVNIIGSNIYDIFEMYSNELSLAALEKVQTFNDLGIATARPDPIHGRITPKLYDNFGNIFLANKVTSQTIDFFEAVQLLMPYRQQLKFLADAYTKGTSVESIQRVGQSFTGIAPVVLQPVKDSIGMKLDTFTALITHVGKNVLVLDNNYGHTGHLLYFDTAPFTEGMTIVFSSAKLGHNAKILDKHLYYSGLKIYMYGSSAAAIFPYITDEASNPILTENGQYITTEDGTFSTGTALSRIQGPFESIVRKIVRGDIDCQFIYQHSNAFSFTRYSLNNIIIGDNVFKDDIPGDYVYNAVNTSSQGNTMRTTVLPLLDTYENLDTHVAVPFRQYDWFYDWATLVKSTEATVNARVRSYSSVDIPDSVYFRDVRDYHQNLTLQSPSGSVSTNWVFHNLGEVYDVLGQNNLTVVGGTGSVEYMRPRHGLKLGLHSKSNSQFLYAGATDDRLNMYQRDFFIEAWVYGVDTSATSSTYFCVKRELGIDTTKNLAFGGYRFLIDGANKTLSLTLRKGALVFTLSADITNIFNEAPYRCHYFAASYVQGIVFLYVDGKLVAQGFNPDGLDVALSGYTSVMGYGNGLGVDEVFISQSPLLPALAKSRFDVSKPYQFTQRILSIELEQFHQLELQVFARAEEFEFHQFSLRAIQLNQYSIKTTGGGVYFSSLDLTNYLITIPAVIEGSLLDEDGFYIETEGGDALVI